MMRDRLFSRLSKKKKHHSNSGNWNLNLSVKANRACELLRRNRYGETMLMVMVVMELCGSRMNGVVWLIERFMCFFCYLDLTLCEMKSWWIFEDDEWRGVFLVNNTYSRTPVHSKKSVTDIFLIQCRFVLCLKMWQHCRKSRSSS